MSAVQVFCFVQFCRNPVTNIVTSNSLHYKVTIIKDHLNFCCSNVLYLGALLFAHLIIICYHADCSVVMNTELSKIFILHSKPALKVCGNIIIVQWHWISIEYRLCVSLFVDYRYCFEAKMILPTLKWSYLR